MSPFSSYFTGVKCELHVKFLRRIHVFHLAVARRTITQTHKLSKEILHFPDAVSMPFIFSEAPRNCLQSV